MKWWGGKVKMFFKLMGVDLDEESEEEGEGEGVGGKQLFLMDRQRSLTLSIHKI